MTAAPEILPALPSVQNRPSFWFYALKRNSAEASPGQPLGLVADQFGCSVRLLRPTAWSLDRTPCVELPPELDGDDCCIVVLGTVSPEEANAESFRRLGVDVFQLPFKSRSKLFRYAQAGDLASFFLRLEREKPHYSLGSLQADTVEDLRWTRCHEQFHDLKMSFGHSCRDELIDPEERDACMSRTFGGAGDPRQGKWHVDPNQWRCFTPCEAWTRLSAVVAKHNLLPTAQTVRDLANLDCQRHRLASLQTADPQRDGAVQGVPPFKWVVILEDSDKAKDALKKDLKNGRQADARVVDVELGKSLREQQLYGRIDGEAAIKKIRFVSTLSKTPDADVIECVDRETLCCFDMRIAPDRDEGLPDGLWFLYRVAVNHPFVCRLVLTGYRMNEMHALRSGAGAVLLKPYSGGELRRAIERSSPFNVFWYCRGAVQDEWAEAAQGFAGPRPGFSWVAESLQQVLNPWRIELSWSAHLRTDWVAESDVVVLDLFHQNENPSSMAGRRGHAAERAPHGPNATADENPSAVDLLATIAEVRTHNPHVDLVVLLPMNDHVTRPGGILGPLRNVLQDGRDQVLYKPLYVGEETDRGLGSTLIRSLRDRPKHDVKYLVLTPAFGLVWHDSRRELERHGTEPGAPGVDRANQWVRWAALGILAGEEIGFTASKADIDSYTELEKRIRDAIRNNRESNRDRWSGLLPEELTAREARIADLAAGLNRTLLAPKGPLETYGSLEKWLEAVLQRKVKLPNDRERKPLTHHLHALFGGETRSSLGSRGVWMDDNNRSHHDTPLVIEFIAKRGIVAREAIRERIIRYLTEMGGEKVVLVQEVPIRGHFWSV